MTKHSTVRRGLVALSAPFLGCLVSCDGSSDTVDDETGEAIVSCLPWHREPVPGTGSVLINNVWNEQWADGQPYQQCLTKQKTDQGLQYGWQWEWPDYKPYASYAAPEALVGWKAWDGGSSTVADLPRRLDTVGSLVVDFAASIEADPTYNLNTTMWLTRSAVATEAPNPLDITNEIMIWFENPAGLGGGNDSDGSVTLEGITFDVSHLVNHEDGSGGTTHTWTMVTYISRVPLQAARFDLNLILQDAIAKGLVNPSDAVGGVELITEVFGGSGRLWLDRFRVEVVAR